MNYLILLAIVGGGWVAFKLFFKNYSFFYGFIHGKQYLSVHGRYLWSGIKGDDYLTKLKNFTEKVCEGTLTEKIKFLDTRIVTLQGERRVLEEERQELEKKLEQLDAIFLNSCSRFTTIWEQILGSHGDEQKKLVSDIQELGNIKLAKKQIEPLVNGLEAELREREKHLNKRLQEIEAKIEAFEKEIIPLQKQNAETRGRKTEGFNKFTWSQLKGAWADLSKSVVALQVSILKYFMLIIVTALLMVDFIVPFQYFREYWSDRIDLQIFSGFGLSFTHHHLSVVIAIVIVLAILIFLEMLFEDFWTKENKEKSSVHRISFQLFSIVNVACVLSAFYFWYQFRQNYMDIDKMLLALTIPIATAAALIIKRLRQGEGFHFLFEPFKTIYYLLSFPAIAIIHVFLFFRQFHFSISNFSEIRQRNKTIRAYKKEIDRLNDQKATIISGFESFKSEQDKEVKKVLGLEMKIFSLEKMLEEKLDGLLGNFSKFEKIFQKEIKKVREEMEKERKMYAHQLKTFPREIKKITKAINKSQKEKESLREGIEFAVQRFEVTN